MYCSIAIDVYKVRNVVDLWYMSFVDVPRWYMYLSAVMGRQPALETASG